MDMLCEIRVEAHVGNNLLWFSHGPDLLQHCLIIMEPTNGDYVEIIDDPFMYKMYTMMYNNEIMYT